LDDVRRAAARAERRIRLGRALSWSVTTLAAALAAAAITLALRKTGLVSEGAARVAFGVEALAVLVGFALGWVRALPLRAGAVALDRYHGLKDRLSSALAFSELPQRTAFMDAAIEDALAAVPGVDPRKAVPILAPRDLPLATGLALGVAVLALFEVREHKPVARQDTIEPVEITPDDLDAMRDFLREQEQKDQSEEAQAAIREFNQLVEDISQKRLDRTEAFRRMEQLEQKLLEGKEGDAKAFEEALKKMGDELKKSDATKPTGEALENKDLAKAQKELHDLAKQLREKPGSFDKAQLEKMREALKAAAQDAEKRKQEIEQKREELKKELLKMKEKMGDAGPQNEQERSLLQKKERELDRLDRESHEQEQAQRQLDRLDRELQQAAEDLMKDLGLSAQDLDNAAEDINRMARREMSQEEKEQLRQKLQELRELLRQQGQGGQQQMVRLMRFQQRARGQGGQQGQGQQGQGQQGQGQQGQGQQGQGQQGQGQQGQGQQGQGQQGQGQQGQGQQGQGQQGQGQQGQGQQGQGQQGQGQQGQGQGQGSGPIIVVGPDGQPILMISKGQGGQGHGQGGQKGPGWGTGHDPNVQGGATTLKGQTQDSQLAGQDTGQGGSRSEIIQGAAERGFASRGYTKVYREYHTVAEEAIDKDEIPGGYRFYVRRYFQLIRPRDSQ
jgi:hypothetical protein